MMNRVLLSFVAGFLATITFHQLALAALHVAGVTPRGAYNLQPVPPFGFPSVLSLAFWGGVWGIVMIFAIARVPRPAYWVVAAVFGAILPTLVAAFVVAPLKGTKLPMTGANIATGLIVNAAWGLGTAITYRLMRRDR